MIVRLRSLGDCVLTTPALRMLKSHRPDLQVAMVVEDRFRGVFEGNPDVADLLAPELAAVAGWHPRLTLNLHGGTRSMWLTLASRAKLRAGFAHHAYSFVYNMRIPRAQEILGEERPVHTAEHLASAMFALGVPQTTIPRASLFAESETPMGALAVLHPFASAAHKAWPAERFVAVARHLRSSGFSPLILAGPGEEVAPFAEFDILRNAPLVRVKSVLSQAQLFVGNDSGPAHMAAAFGVPVVVLFGPSDPVTWAPWRTESQVLTAPEGMAAIEVGQVLEAIDRLKVRA
jgi:heptosyltransferase III